MTILSACHTPRPPGGPGCKTCAWENFLDKPMRVQRIECTNQGKPEHCHLTTEKGVPKREVTVTFNQATGAYNWTLVTSENPKDRMDCPNLAPDLNNRRVLLGNCIITESDHGPAVHFFRATIRPKEEDPTKGRVVGEFRHTPFGVGSREPVHDGHIHLDPE